MTTRVPRSNSSAPSVAPPNPASTSQPLTCDSHWPTPLIRVSSDFESRSHIRLRLSGYPHHGKSAPSATRVPRAPRNAACRSGLPLRRSDEDGVRHLFRSVFWVFRSTSYLPPRQGVAAMHLRQQRCFDLHSVPLFQYVNFSASSTCTCSGACGSHVRTTMRGPSGPVRTTVRDRSLRRSFDRCTSFMRASRYAPGACIATRVSHLRATKERRLLGPRGRASETGSERKPLRICATRSSRNGPQCVSRHALMFGQRGEYAA